MAKQRMKAKVLDIGDLSPDEVEELLNDTLKELAEYYVHDIMQIDGKTEMLAILYFTQKKEA